MSGAVRLAAVEVFAVDLPFRQPFRHAAAERSRSQSVFLKCITDTDVVGFGECLPRPYVSGETQAGAYALLLQALAPRLVGRTFASMAEVEDFLLACDGSAPRAWVRDDTPQGAAWCAVDLALLDTFGRAFEARPLAAQAQRLPPGFRYSGVLSADPRLRLALNALKQRLFGLRQIKVKIDPRASDAAVRWIRRLCGPHVELRLDANMGWTYDEARARMAALSRCGIRSFEQPLAADDVRGLARLTAETQLGVMADESFTTRASLRRLIDLRACTAVNARLSKCGGLMATLARCREALAAGLEVQIGCQVGESSLLSSAHLLLSAAVGHVRYAEGCFGRRLLRRDPAAPVLQFRYGGRPPTPPPGPGFGVSVDEGVLARFATRRDVVRDAGRSAWTMRATGVGNQRGLAASADGAAPSPSRSSHHP